MPREVRKQSPIPKPHICSLLAWHISAIPAVFFFHHGRKESVVSGCEVCGRMMGDTGGRVGDALTWRAAPTWGVQTKARIILSEAGRKASERDAVNWQKSPPPVPTPTPSPEPVWSPLFRSCCWRWWTASPDGRIQLFRISTGWNWEPKLTIWNFTGINIKCFPGVQSLSYTRTSLSWMQFMWKRPGVFNWLELSMSQMNLCHQSWATLIGMPCPAPRR